MLRGIGRLRAGGGQVPSLSLDFVSSETADSRITVSGGAGGTRVNSSGNIVAASAPRFDFDPVTLAARGVLVEEQRTNAALSSEDLRSTGGGNPVAAWAYTNMAPPSADATTAPSGQATADKIIADATNGNHYDEQLFSSLADSTTYSASIFVKKADYDRVRLAFIVKNGSGPVIEYRFSDNTITVQSGGTGQTGVTFTVDPLANGWYRLKINGFSTLTGATTPRVRAQIVDDTGSVSFAGDSSKGTYFWGVQVEQGAFVTSYIPTTTAAVTRTADSLTMTGSNFSSWWNAAQGTFVTEHTFEGTGSGGTTRILEAHDGTASNRIIIGDTGTQARGLVSVSGSAQYDQTASYGAQSPRKSALSFQAADFQIAAAGSLGTAGASGSVPAVTTLSIGGSNGLVFGGIWVRRVKFFPTRLLNAQDQVLTQ